MSVLAGTSSVAALRQQSRSLADSLLHLQAEGGMGRSRRMTTMMMNSALSSGRSSNSRASVIVRNLHMRRIHSAPAAGRSATSPSSSLPLSPASFARRHTFLQHRLIHVRPISRVILERTLGSSLFRLYSSHASSSSTQTEDPRDADTSIRGRLKTLSRKYGWAAVVVYILFSVLDFGLVFFLINLIGADHVRDGQDWLLDMLVYGKHGTSHQELGQDGPEETGNGPLGWLLKDWRERKKLEAKEHAAQMEKEGQLAGTGKRDSLYATAILAYGIHKTLLLPVRIGLTATATPAIVRFLQRFGINIAKNPVPASVQARGAERLEKSRQAVQRARGRHGDWL